MRPSDYLPPGTPAMNVAIVENAHDDIGEGEDLDAQGRGTNRSEFVDRANVRFDSPLGSYWCANVGSGWWADAGAAIPPVPGSCEVWRTWAQKTGRWRTKPRPGYAILYGTTNPTHAEHWELVARLVKDQSDARGYRVIVIGGNTSLGRYNRDGWIVAEKIEDTARVLGYVSPDPDDGWS